MTTEDAAAVGAAAGPAGAPGTAVPGFGWAFGPGGLTESDRFPAGGGPYGAARPAPAAPVAPGSPGATPGELEAPWTPELEALALGVRAGQRRALAKAITLVESSRPEHRAQAETLLAVLLPEAGGALRIGISGAPGAGKSTFIETFGTRLADDGQKVAVLAVDPSSAVSGGSILGDKTRMGELARHPNTFIRPSPSGGSLGGVARRTREALLLCEAAGFDVVLVETVGVGQSETAVAHLVDLFLLLVAPGGGDELQGIKRGVMELAELVVVNKADGDLAPAAGRAAAELANAMHLLRPLTPAWTPRVLRCSAIEGTGIAEVEQAAREHRAALEASGDLARRRAAQATSWMWSELQERLLADLRADPAVARQLPRLEALVAGGKLAPGAAARRLLAAFHGAPERPGDAAPDAG